jgi:hypothetical protein
MSDGNREWGMWNVECGKQQLEALPSSRFPILVNK